LLNKKERAPLQIIENDKLMNHSAFTLLISCRRKITEL